MLSSVVVLAAEKKIDKRRPPCFLVAPPQSVGPHWRNNALLLAGTSHDPVGRQAADLLGQVAMPEDKGGLHTGKDFHQRLGFLHLC